MVQKPKRRRLSLNCWHFSAIWDRDVRFPPNESWNILVFVSFMPCVIILWNHVWKPQLLSCQTFFSWKILQISSLPIPTAGDPNSWCFWLFLDQFWHNICLKIYVRKSWVKLLKFLQPRANSMHSVCARDCGHLHTIVIVSACNFSYFCRCVWVRACLFHV